MSKNRKSSKPSRKPRGQPLPKPKRLDHRTLIPRLESKRSGRSLKVERNPDLKDGDLQSVSPISSSLLATDTVYTFRLGGTSSINSSSGAVDTSISFDPSTNGFSMPEWSSISALFNEFRIRSFHAQFCLAHTNATTDAGPVLIIGSNLGVSSGSPGSYAAVGDNADARMWSCFSDRSATGYTHHVNCAVVGWGDTTTDTAKPYAGGPGCLQIFGQFGSTNTTAQIRVLVWGIYEFRSRI